MKEINHIPKHWQVKKLGEVCQIIMGQSPPSYTYNFEKVGLPFFQGKTEFTELYPVVRKWCSKPNKISEPDDILISVRAPVGPTNISNVQCCIGRGLAAIRYANNYKFVFYYLRSVEKRLEKLATGTTFSAISGETIRNLDFPYPPFPEQQAIVAKIEDLFSELDNGIAQLKTAQQQLKVYRQSLLKWSFEGKLTNKNVKDGELPKGWEVAYLKDVCEIKRGKSKHRPRNEPSLFGGKYPFIQTGDIREVNGGYITKYSQTYSEMGLQQSKLWPKGTLCITIAANIGETAILSFPACFPDSVVGLLCNQGKLLNKYTNYFFISHKSKLEKLAPATAQKNINVDILEKVNIPLPKLDEQQLIVDELESKLTVCDKIEETISQSLQQAATLRQSILKKAFEGKLVKMKQ